MGKNTILWLTMFSVLNLLFIHPAFASYGGLPWETPLEIVVDALNSSTGTLMATLAVMVAGTLALLGRIPWGYFGAVLFGITCIFGAGRLVAIFHG